jgi:predicted phosphodiesterase
MKRFIDYLEQYGKTESWLDLAIKFDIKNSKGEHDGKTASDMWLIHLTTRGTIDANLKVKKVWITPEGKVGKSFEVSNDTELDINPLLKQLENDFIITPRLIYAPNNIGVVCVSDLHTGSVVKALHDTIKSREFNVKILEEYLQETADLINSYGFSEVHLMMPGDLIESFSAFNHGDTWKSVEKYEGEVVMCAYKVMKAFLQSVFNIHTVYMTEGNHDRFIAKKEDNSRKGVVELVAFFLKENSSLNIEYHPFIVTKEVDGINYIMSHGDYKVFKNYDNFLFTYGKQGMYNVLITGHYHEFKIHKSDQVFTHIGCPSIFTGNFFSESMGCTSAPGFLVITNLKDKPKIDFLPL